ncbi:DoxX family protein [Allomuricauda sp. SCSIO 65647]|uniref:DoxX family protein n=1 Tax=Allomuricauda sp. SCSIO 65647 TaxID=2908843 RepID=UPI001F3A7D54|nr:DoxX family membrane protein [Muricauda sp. SCSIO 65647]UJH67997.1 DoxX family membrane protein [Muricauda sp. SCSIO 65647]
MKSNWQLKHSIVLLRILIGWHFLYEGITKMYDPDWTSFGYLASAQGPLKPFFTWLTSDALIGWVDTLNVVALILVGITLILGFLEKIGALAGIGLLALYYLAHPSLPWLPQINVEGSYWFVNKNLIELVACMILYQHPTGHVFGLGCFFKNNKRTAKIEKV